MSKYKTSKDKQSTNAQVANPQEKLVNAVNSVPGDNQNQSHNIKKQAMGPNIKR